MPSYLDDYPQQSNLPQGGTQDQMTPLQSRVATEVTPSQPVQLILSKVKNNDYIGKFGADRIEDVVNTFSNMSQRGAEEAKKRNAINQAREEERQRRIKELEAKNHNKLKHKKLKMF